MIDSAIDTAVCGPSDTGLRMSELLSDNDDDSIEGAIARSLFRTDSDSSSDGEPDDEHVATTHEKDEDSLAESNCDGGGVRREIKIMHVVLEEHKIGGSIAHRLWPAAEFLAEFVIEIASRTAATTTIQNTEDSEKNHNRKKNTAGLSHNNDNSKREEIMGVLRAFFNQRERIDDAIIPIIELGAGIGLTGLEIATQIDNTSVLLTDLDIALPLLHRNKTLNESGFRMRGPNAVRVQKLEWGCSRDCQRALDWYRDIISNQNQEQPLLILASDCVYWDELHQPLEETLVSLLSKVPIGSVCLIAGMRRWKHDNKFYQSLGKKTKTASHQLECICLHETVTYEEAEKDICNDNDTNNNKRRQIMRIYGVRWTERKKRNGKKKNNSKE